MSERPIVVGLGEALWDLLPAGPRFGGAPANFACHAAMLGADAHVVSRVGEDDLGEQAIDELRRCGVGVEGVASGPYSTGVVHVEVGPEGSPRYEIGSPAAWDQVEWSDALATLASQADAVCFGSLAQRAATTRETIRALPACGAGGVFASLRREPPPAIRRRRDRARIANVVQRAKAQRRGVARRRRGSRCGRRRRAGDDGHASDSVRPCPGGTHARPTGALLYDGAFAEDAGIEVQVADTIGAGDAFTATVVVGLLQGRPLKAIVRHACRVAAFVCTQSGATPTLPDELRR